MDEQIVTHLLEQLYEFEVQRDAIDVEKRKLLDQVQIPEEIKEIIADGNRRINELKTPLLLPDPEFDKQILAELDAIVIPDEIRWALAEIDRKRALVMERKSAHQRDKEREVALLREEVERQRLEIQTEVDEKVKATYDAVAQRRLDIEDEFAGKKENADKSISYLKKQIENAMKEFGKTVKSEHRMAVYVSGRVTWNTDGLDEFIIQGHEELKPFRKVGEPSIQIRNLDLPK